MVAAVVVVQHDPQSHGVDLSAVLRGCQIGVLLVPAVAVLIEVHLVSPVDPLADGVILVGGQIACAQGPVVVQGNIVDLGAFQNGLIARLRLGNDVSLPEIAHIIAGVSAFRVHFQAVVGLHPVVHLGGPHILRLVGQRIGAGGGHGGAHLAVLDELVAGVDGQGVGQEHMVVHLGPDLVRLPLIRLYDVHPLVYPDH